MKPSYGRVSRYGLIAYGSSLDQIGPITKTVTDAALLLELIAGADPRDSTTMPVNAPDFSAALTGEIEGMRIGIPEEYFVEGIQPEVEDAVRSAIDHFASLGAEIVPIGLPNTELALPQRPAPTFLAMTASVLDLASTAIRFSTTSGRRAAPDSGPR